MSKRVAEKQLDHFNWNDEDEPEEAGVYKAAAPDILKRRVIKTAKRRMPAKNDGESKSAFSGFGGFGSSATSGAPSGLKTFSFLSKSTSNGTSTSSPSEFSFSQSPPMEITKKDDNPSSSECITTSSTPKKSEEYLAKLKGLNESLVDWIKMHVDKNPVCILTPIFQDYEKYLKEIDTQQSTSKDNVDAQSSESTTGFTFKSASPFSFKPSAKPDATDELSSTKEEKTSFSDQKPLPSPFSSTLPNSGGLFKFGSTQSSPSTGMTFGSPLQFNFVKPPDGNTEDDDQEDNEEDDSPPKVEFSPVVEENSLFSQRVKVFVKKGDKYNDCGIGTLFLKEVSGKYQAIVRADTSLGNLIFNIIISKDLPCKKLGKNVMVICHPLPPTPDPKTKAIPPPGPVLLKVKTDEEADKLLAEFEKCKK